MRSKPSIVSCRNTTTTARTPGTTPAWCSWGQLAADLAGEDLVALHYVWPQRPILWLRTHEASLRPIGNHVAVRRQQLKPSDLQLIVPRATAVGPAREVPGAG